MLKVNVRHPRDFMGDLAAQIGSVRLGERRLLEFVEELGADTIADSADRILDAAEAETRAIIAGWKDGTYEGEALLDDDGRGNPDIAIRATATVAGSDLRVDLTESDPQVRSFLNSSWANTRSAVMMALTYLLDPDIAKNDGTMRPVEIVAKRGTIVWSDDWAPVTMSTSHCGQEIIEAVVTALAPACPEQTMAAWGKRLRIALKGRDPRSGRDFIWHMFHARPGAGGLGRRRRLAQLRRVAFGGGPQVRLRRGGGGALPVLLPAPRVPPQLGGATGRHVGGAGGELEFVVETEESCVANTAGTARAAVRSG